MDDYSSLPKGNRMIKDCNYIMAMIARDKDIQGFDLRICLLIGLNALKSQSDLLKLSGSNRPNLSRSLSKLVAKGYVIQKQYDDIGLCYHLAFDKYDYATKGTAGHQMSFLDK